MASSVLKEVWKHLSSTPCVPLLLWKDWGTLKIGGYPQTPGPSWEGHLLVWVGCGVPALTCHFVIGRSDSYEGQRSNLVGMFVTITKRLLRFASLAMTQRTLMGTTLSLTSEGLARCFVPLHSLGLLKKLMANSCLFWGIPILPLGKDWQEVPCRSFLNV